MALFIFIARIVSQHLLVSPSVHEGMGGPIFSCYPCVWMSQYVKNQWNNVFRINWKRETPPHVLMLCYCM